MRILVADDEDLLRSALARLLRSWGHEVEQARDGEEALRILSGPDAPEVAILDWMMPAPSGVEVCRRLRSMDATRYCYVILLSGRSDRLDRLEGLDAGADEYITKPFEAREIEARLRTASRLLGLENRRPARPTPPDILTAQVPDHESLLEVFRAALGRQTIPLALDRRPTRDGEAMLDLTAPGLAAPIRLAVDSAGAETNGRFPLVIRPLDALHAEQLRSYLELEWSRASFPAFEATALGTPSLGSHADGAGGVGLAGQSIARGRYELTRLIGSGATGMVYRARQVMLDRTVAIKVLHPIHQDNAEVASRFHREALAASRLDHPNVTRILDFGREGPGLLYLVMEYLDGPTLADVLAREGRLPVDRALRVVGQVLAALAAAHDAGIVHRDVKPENVILLSSRDDAGNALEAVKVCDFGIAKLIGQRSAENRITSVGSVWGTPSYMSPEQAQAREVDARSDLYSCGVLLYELVTGRCPFTAGSPLALLHQHVYEAPPRPSAILAGLDPRLEALLLHALAKSPEARPASARAMRDGVLALCRS